MRTSLADRATDHLLTEAERAIAARQVLVVTEPEEVDIFCNNPLRKVDVAVHVVDITLKVNADEPTIAKGARKKIADKTGQSLQQNELSINFECRDPSGKCSSDQRLENRRINMAAGETRGFGDWCIFRGSVTELNVVFDVKELDVTVLTPQEAKGGCAAALRAAGAPFAGLWGWCCGKVVEKIVQPDNLGGDARCIRMVDISKTSGSFDRPIVTRNFDFTLRYHLRFSEPPAEMGEPTVRRVNAAGAAPRLGRKQSASALPS